MLDRYNYTSPARVQTLLVPVNGCTLSQFNRYVDLLQTVDEVRLIDITPAEGLKYFNPQVFPNGRVLFDFLTSGPDDSSIFLHDLEPFRKTFIVVGLGPYNETIDNTAGLETTRKLKEVHTSSISHVVIYFDAPDDTIEKLNPPSDHSLRSVFYHNGSAQKDITALNTVFCDLARVFLSNLDTYASSYLNITLRSPISLNNSGVLTKTITRTRKRIGSGSLKSTTVMASPDAKKKNLQRHTGRQSKLLGSLYLLAGNYHEAAFSFSEAVVLLRTGDDYLWLGSALEGLGVSLAMLQFIGHSLPNLNSALNSFIHLPKHKTETAHRNSNDSSSQRNSVDSSSNSSRDNTNNLSPRDSSTSIGGFSISTITSSVEPSSLPLPLLIQAITTKALDLYRTSVVDHENMVPDVVYIESTLRFIKFMLAFFVGGDGSITEVLENLVHLVPFKNDSYNSKFFLKSEILKDLDKVLSLQLSELHFVDQCRIYSTIATIYSDMGMLRKRALMLRTLLACLHPRLESLPQDAALDIKNSVGSLRKIFDFLFVVYRIDSETESDKAEAFHHAEGVWTSLKILVLRLCMNFAEAIDDPILLLQVCTLLMTRFCNSLTSDDQLKLKDKIEKTLVGHRLDTPYWDPFMVRKVKLINDQSREELVSFSEYEKSSSTISQLDTSSKNVTEQDDRSINSLQNPLIFNPFDKAKPELQETILLKDEVYRLKVTLQNPFAFEVEIHDLTVVADEEDAILTLKNLIKPMSYDNSKPKAPSSLVRPQSPPYFGDNDIFDLVIPPRSVQHFFVAFKPLKPGEFTLKGFSISASHCRNQFFQIVDEEYAYTFDKVKSIGVRDIDLSNEQVLDKVYTNLRANDIATRVLTSTIQITVIPLQPSLALNDILITNRWIMLYEGEKYEFSISLINTSDQEINYLSFSFWDSTLDYVGRKLAVSGQKIPASDVYELEWSLLKEKPFRILNKEILSEDHKTIKPGDEVRIQYEMTGKRAMKQLKIILEYANKGLLRSFVKFIEVPFNLSVMPFLEMVNCEILSSVTSISSVDPSLLTEKFKDVVSYIKRTSDIASFCILAIDLRNVRPDKVRARLEFQNPDADVFKCEEVIMSNSTSRLLLPVRRVTKNDALLADIPSLRHKQFIKNYQLTPEEESNMKVMFWLRKYILDGLKGTWETIKEEKGSHERYGNIPLRGIRLTNFMVQALSYPEIEIINTIHQEDGTKLQSNGNIDLDIDEFYVLRTLIQNNSPQPITGVLRQVPYPVQGSNVTGAILKNNLSLDRKLLIHGLLQNHIQDVIAPGEKAYFDLTFVVLEKGDYEWGTVFDIQGKDQVSSREPLTISV